MSPLAKRLGRYPSSRTALCTRSAVEGATSAGLLITRLTVAIETPAAVATSLIDTAPRRAELPAIRIPPP